MSQVCMSATLNVKNKIVTSKEKHEDEIIKLLSNQYQLENRGQENPYTRPKVKTTEELEADLYLEKNIKFKERYAEAPVLWKDQANGPNLPLNYRQALKMFHALEASWGKGKKTKEIKEQYYALFMDWIDRGVLEKVEY